MSDRACVHCGHREGSCSGSPVPPPGDRGHLWDWFDRKMEEMHEDLVREREKIFGPTFGDVRGFLSPQRRQRMFDTMFPDRPGYHIGAPQPPRFERDTKSGLMRLELETGEEITPEEVEVKVHGRDVSFHAKHEKRSNDGRDYSFREIHRQFPVPEEANIERLEAKLEGGKVVLTAPPFDVRRKRKDELEIPVKVLRSEL
ncbi:alpha-crystallin B chain [Galendromus occidentalis]|uniref:Alpha-crystallin B chain n=1 Tax=Galendromus occidentalis TaxID=34638 RepID=A0AAJ6QUK7_9ACAR|nr:alpha-crystallin B chain [Galendromus occidentalis]